jgi:serine/threonine-protein kinase
MFDANGRAKVADFGIAQMSTETRMTQSGMLVGTPEYISPEQCHGEKLDGRSDIYALGITLYQLLSGRTPFDADTPAALVLQIVDGMTPQVGDLNPTVPPDVQTIVAKMMHTDRNQRFQSAEDLVHALERADTRPVTSATRPHPAPAVAAAPSGPAKPTEAMPPQDPTAAAPAATTEAVPPTEAMPGPPPDVATDAATRPSPGAAAEATPASSPAAPTDALPATAQEPPAPPARPSPATEAYARGSNNRAALFGLAAIVLIIITVVFVGWQVMGDSDADETFDPTAEARPQALPVPEEDPSSGAAGQTEPSGDPADAATQPPVEDPVGETTPAVAQRTPPAVSQQTPPSEGAEPAVEEEDAFVPPPDNSIVADTSGEYEYVEQVHAWMEGEFGDQDFEVVDFSSSTYPSLQAAARFQVVTTARLVGTQDLQFFGNVQTQFTVSLTSRVNDLATGVTVVGPETATVKYTVVNMQQNLEKGVTDLARGMAQELRRLLRIP